MKPEHKLSIGIVSLIALTALMFYLSQMGKGTEETKKVPRQTKFDPDSYNGMYDRAKTGDPEVKSLALEYIKNTAPFTREKGVNLLALYQDADVTDTLQEMLKDPHEKVKIRAIHGLALLKMPERESILIDHINSKELNNREKVHLYTALLRITSDEKTKSLCIDHLVYILNNAKNERTVQLASSTLSQQPLSNEKINSAFKKHINNKNPVVAANIIRYFASTNSKWFKDNAVKFHGNKKLPETVKVALVETLHLTCPKERQDYFKAYLQTQSKQVVQATLQQLIYHNNEDTITLLKKYILRENIDAFAKKTAERTLSRIGNRADRCKGL